MPNRRYQSGRRAEWELRKSYQQLGYIVVRAAGSKGKIDLVALDEKTGLTHLIQVKSVKDGTEADAKRLWLDFRSDPPARTCSNWRRVLWVKLGKKLGWRTFYME